MTIETLLCDKLRKLQRVDVVGIQTFQRIRESNKKHILHHGSSQLLEEDFLKTRTIFSKHFEPHTPSGKTSHVAKNQALHSKTLQHQTSYSDGSHFIHITIFLCSQQQIVVLKQKCVHLLWACQHSVVQVYRRFAKTRKHHWTIDLDSVWTDHHNNDILWKLHLDDIPIILWLHDDRHCLDWSDLSEMPLHLHVRCNCMHEDVTVSHKALRSNCYDMWSYCKSLLDIRSFPASPLSVTKWLKPGETCTGLTCDWVVCISLFLWLKKSFAVMFLCICWVCVSECRLMGLQNHRDLSRSGTEVKLVISNWTIVLRSEQNLSNSVSSIKTC